MERNPSFPDSSTVQGAVTYWRTISRWFFFTTVDALSCLLFVFQYIVYAKPAFPLTPVYVPPDVIELTIEPTRFVRRRLYWFSGIVKRKNWERIVPQRPKHKLLVDEFKEVFALGNSQMLHQEQPDLISYQSLFETLSTKGFATPTWRSRATDPFCLCIGANGEFLFMTGKHRLALAQVAGVKAIPARISARHWKWQAYRDELYRKGRDGELSQAQLDAIEHPDLQDVIHAIRRVRPGN